MCDYKMAGKESLKAPLRSKHEELKLKCQMCEFKSVHRSSMLSHTKIAHIGIKFTLAINVNTQMFVAGNSSNMLKESTAQYGFFFNIKASEML